MFNPLKNMNGDVSKIVFEYLMCKDKLMLSYCSNSLYKTFKTMKHVEPIYFICRGQYMGRLQDKYNKCLPNMNIVIMGMISADYSGRPGCAHLAYC